MARARGGDRARPHGYAAAERPRETGDASARRDEWERPRRGGQTSPWTDRTERVGVDGDGGDGGSFRGPSRGRRGQPRFELERYRGALEHAFLALERVDAWVFGTETERAGDARVAFSPSFLAVDDASKVDASNDQSVKDLDRAWYDDDEGGGHGDAYVTAFAEYDGAAARRKAAPETARDAAADR